VTKRFFDLLISTVSLILLFPFFLVLGILIKIDSMGPVLFVQKRVGKKAKPFDLFKMVKNHTIHP